MPKRQPSLLITAGPTREYLDPVRFLSNPSSGKMGLALALEGVRLGYAVALVLGPVSLVVPKKPGLTVHPVTSAQEMLRVSTALFKRADVFVAAAAVADFRPLKYEKHKMKKRTATLTLHLVPTPDIHKTLGNKKRAGQCLVGFALETREGRKNALLKMAEKNLDLIVLNTPENFGTDQAKAILIDRNGQEKKLTGSKRGLARKILEAAARQSPQS